MGAKRFNIEYEYVKHTCFMFFFSQLLRLWLMLCNNVKRFSRGYRVVVSAIWHDECCSSLFQSVKRVIGVEIIENAVEDAKANAQLNGEFCCSELDHKWILELF